MSALLVLPALLTGGAIGGRRGPLLRWLGVGTESAPAEDDPGHLPDDLLAALDGAPRWRVFACIGIRPEPGEPVCPGGRPLAFPEPVVLARSEARPLARALVRGVLDAPELVCACIEPGYTIELTHAGTRHVLWVQPDSGHLYVSSYPPDGGERTKRWFFFPKARLPELEGLFPEERPPLRRR